MKPFRLVGLAAGVILLGVSALPARAQEGARFSPSGNESQAGTAGNLVSPPATTQTAPVPSKQGGGTSRFNAVGQVPDKSLPPVPSKQVPSKSLPPVPSKQGGGTSRFNAVGQVPDKSLPPAPSKQGGGTTSSTQGSDTSGPGGTAR